jgi:hypothetical protein
LGVIATIVKKYCCMASSPHRPGLSLMFDQLTPVLHRDYTIATHKSHSHAAWMRKSSILTALANMMWGVQQCARVSQHKQWNLWIKNLPFSSL